MTGGAEAFEPRRARLWRWLASAVVVAGLHAAGAALTLAHWHEEEETADEAAGAIAVELAPIEEATPLDMPDVAHGPQMEEAELTPQPAQQAVEEPEEEIPEVEESPLAPEPEVVLPTQKQVEEEKPIEEESREAIPETPTPVQQAAAPLTTAPPKIEAKEATRTVAPQPGTSLVPARVLASWQKRLVTHLDRFKRYPQKARASRDEGIVKVQFTLDRTGRVISSHVIASSGSAILDQEALGVLERASPLPTPPEDISDAALVLILPINFRIK